jgi:hypothetical protein
MLLVAQVAMWNDDQGVGDSGWPGSNQLDECWMVAHKP